MRSNMTMIQKTDLPKLFKMREDGQTYDQIAAYFGVSNERVRQIIERDRHDLTGRIVHAHFCDNCGKTFTQTEYGGRVIKDYFLGPLCVCIKCWRAISPYTHAWVTKLHYLKPYKFIKDQIKIGLKTGCIQKAYDPTWNGKNPYIWVTRVITQYEKAELTLAKMEKKHGWIKKFFNKRLCEVGSCS